MRTTNLRGVALALQQLLPAGSVIELEHEFHPTRKWRFDLAVFLPDGVRVALEVDGGAWIGGRHTSGGGFIADMEKSNEAQLLGWILLRCTPSQVKKGAAVTLIHRAASLIANRKITPGFPNV